jgi:hypothetical protein
LVAIAIRVHPTIFQKKTSSIRRGFCEISFLSARNLLLQELAPSLEGGLPWSQRAGPSTTLDKNYVFNYSQANYIQPKRDVKNFMDARSADPAPGTLTYCVLRLAVLSMLLLYRFFREGRGKRIANVPSKQLPQSDVAALTLKWKH